MQKSVAEMYGKLFLQNGEFLRIKKSNKKTRITGNYSCFDFLTSRERKREGII